MYILKWFRFKLKYLKNDRTKGIRNWKISYSVILSVLSNKTNLILGFSSPLKWSYTWRFLTQHCCAKNWYRVRSPRLLFFKFDYDIFMSNYGCDLWSYIVGLFWLFYLMLHMMILNATLLRAKLYRVRSPRLLFFLSSIMRFLCQIMDVIKVIFGRTYYSIVTHL